MFKQKQLIFLQKQRQTWKKNFERHSHLSMQHKNFNITSFKEIPWVLSVDIHLAVSLYCDKHQQMCVSSAHDTVFWQVSHNPQENGREISLNKQSFAFVPGDKAQSYEKERVLPSCLTAATQHCRAFSIFFHCAESMQAWGRILSTVAHNHESQGQACALRV